MASIDRVFGDLGLEVFQRGWLSSNNVLFHPRRGAPSTVVDTGYVAHAEQTAALLSASLGGVALERVVNTHLHSDHCGGNAVLYAQYGCEVVVPAASCAAVSEWDAGRLSFLSTGQRCDRFPAHGAIAVGQTLNLGAGTWQVVAAPGHDPEALMFFEPNAGVLISADALWEERLSIIFPELQGESGFLEARAALDVIERLAPRIVIPGHGRPFVGVKAALQQSRSRIDAFERQPGRHALYGARALTMFHMLEHRQRRREDLVTWLCSTPVFETLHGRLDDPPETLEAFSDSLIRSLVASGQLRAVEPDIIEMAD